MSRVLLFNKPFNVLSQFSDRDERLAPTRQTLAAFVDAPGLRPAGRLDRDSEGLLVLTDRGDLIHELTQPGHRTTKTYWVQVEGEPRDEDLDLLRDGIDLNDGPCLPARAQVEAREPWFLWPRDPPIRVRRSVPTCWITVTLSEGRNRQVRRMCAAIGFPALRLIRYRIGSWTVDGLAPGAWREVG